MSHLCKQSCCWVSLIATQMFCHLEFAVCLLFFPPQQTFMSLCSLYCPEKVPGKRRHNFGDAVAEYLFITFKQIDQISQCGIRSASLPHRQLLCIVFFHSIFATVKMPSSLVKLMVTDGKIYASIHPQKPLHTCASLIFQAFFCDLSAWLKEVATSCFISCSSMHNEI